MPGRARNLPGPGPVQYNMLMTRILVFAALLAAAGQLAAQDTAYRWMDENGVTHFSDRPPVENTGVTRVPIPEYEPPEGPVFSYVAMLERLRALEREVEATRRAAEQRPTPAPIVIQQQPYPETRYVSPHFFPRRPGRHPPSRQPEAPDRQTASSRFDRLVEGTRDRYEPPRN